MKAHELARELGISQKELVNFLQQRRLTRNAAAPLAPGAIDAARSAFKPASVAVKIEPNGDRKVVLPPTLTVKDLAEKLGVSPVEVIKKLMASKILATINQVIDFATAEIVADEFGFTVEPVASEDVVAVESAEGEGAVVTTSREELFSLANEDPSKLVTRPPIVTVMGHVDHGKTSILDAIRQTRVASGEAGGITQRIGAYKIETADGHPVVFIDTPGHEAFTAMRARGAQVTDLVVLVVAADDGVMPQTIEAIQHARAAKVPIIVAINKIDKDNANVDRVHQELAEQGIVTRHYGGEFECVHVSARTGQGIDDLLTTIVLASDILELKANPEPQGDRHHRRRPPRAGPRPGRHGARAGWDAEGRRRLRVRPHLRPRTSAGGRPRPLGHRGRARDPGGRLGHERGAAGRRHLPGGRL